MTSKCRGKECLTKKQAQDRVIYRWLHKGISLRPYQCVVCDWYHLTKQLNE